METRNTNNAGLDRFLKAQESDYETALREIKAGHKRSHWIWYIFPQIQGLGYSSMSQYYGIRDREEAEAYLEHPVLRGRLVEISQALLALPSNGPGDVMGYPDDLKLKSSMTLFALVSEEPVFQQVLDKFFDGKMDGATVESVAYRIRAHHGLCTAFFKGKGYSDGFTKHMAQVIEKLERNPVILPVEGADEICRCCPNLEEGACNTPDKVSRYDRDVLALCGLPAEEPVRWNDFRQRVTDRIIRAGKRGEICGECRWNELCSAKEAHGVI